MLFINHELIDLRKVRIIEIRITGVFVRVDWDIFERPENFVRVCKSLNYTSLNYTELIVLRKYYQ